MQEVKSFIITGEALNVCKVAAMIILVIPYKDFSVNEAFLWCAKPYPGRPFASDEFLPKIGDNFSSRTAGANSGGTLEK
ncbi:MAG: hypothetical protein K2P94_10800 [Rhodospirillaceae bacterium]|nr:hypothetical protein [Rhodospirillaceae bacterium]